MRNSEIEFGNFSAGKGSRTPNEIINHMFYVLRATKLYIQKESFDKEAPENLNLKLEIDRFSLELKNILFTLQLSCSFGFLINRFSSFLSILS